MKWFERFLLSAISKSKTDRAKKKREREREGEREGERGKEREIRTQRVRKPGVTKVV